MKVDFSISGPMICGSYEAERKDYRRVIGRSGRRWYVPMNNSPADGIHVSGGPSSDGYGGRTLAFKCSDGGVYEERGPWHSNADSLFQDTGVDVRDTHMMTYVISLGRESLDHLGSYKMLDVLEMVLTPTAMRYNTPAEHAKAYANALGRTVYVSSKSVGGGCAGWQSPDK